MKVAVIGAGIAGLSAAYRLRRDAQVTLFEAEPRFGGHAHTVDITLPDASGRPVTHGVDTGFLVFNERTYPQLVQLFGELRVDTAPSDMSFSVQVPRAFGVQSLEWSGSSLASVFAQRANLLRPRFWGMLREVLRFNALATEIARAGADADLRQPLAAFLDVHGFSAAFRDWYLLPMIGCIWSCPPKQMLHFPTGTLVRFCHNHGLLQVNDRPQWYTVRGGSRRYVDKVVAALPDARAGTPVLAVRRDDAGVDLRTAHGWERFDAAILACHAGQSLALLADARPEERRVLGAIRTQDNLAVLHTDASMLPRGRRAWAAWNFERAAGDAPVCLHYLLDRLQPLPWPQPVIVTLNPVREIAPQHLLGSWRYAHPVFDAPAMRAQAELGAIQGRRRTWFAGAWTGYGFHEDGLASGVAAARSVLVAAQVEAADTDLGLLSA